MLISFFRELWVETSNRMVGVPFAENFTVDTKWRVVETGENQCKFTSYVRVVFTKTVTLVKSKIEKSSIQGTTDYFKAYQAHLRSKFEGEATQQNGTDGNNVGVTNGEGRGGPARNDKINLSTILAIAFGLGCAFFFILWLWYWWSAGSWSVYVSELEARNLELEIQLEKQQGIPLGNNHLTGIPAEFYDPEYWQQLQSAVDTVNQFIQVMKGVDVKSNTSV